MGSRLIGPFFIAIASVLWATDALFRLPATQHFTPAFVVWVEHLICVVVLLFAVGLKSKGQLFKLSGLEWLAAVIVGAGGSALATLLFTASFRYINPTVAILLQKLQPVLVVVLAIVLLGEHPRKSFFIWAVIALGGALFLGFPDLGFSFLEDPGGMQIRGVIYALSAAGIWALATIAGKKLLNRVTTLVATFWRFAFGFFTLSGLLYFSESSVEWSVMSDFEILKPLLYMGLVPGVTAMLFYYSGMRRTTASITTCVELLFPVGAVALNTLFLNTPLLPSQMIAGSILLVAVVRISFLD